MGNKHINKIKKDKIKKDEKKEKIEKIEIIQKVIYKYNILFVGEANVGTKTSLIKRIKTGKFIDNIGDDEVNREKITYEKDNKKIILYLIDTNPEKYIDPKEGLNNEINYYNADCIIMGYDITNKQSFEEIKSFWYNKIKEKK